MKRLSVLLASAFVVFAAVSSPASATGDTGWSCPAGTTHSYKLDNLSGPTFTVPDASAGWHVLGVSIKAGPDHYDYPDATSGDVIAVKADTGHDTSHAHVCERRTPTTTTSTTSTTTTTTTTTTEVPPSTSTTVPDTTSSTTSTTAPMTTVPATTSTSSPSTSTTTPGTTSSTTTTAPPDTSSSTTSTTSAPTTTAVETTSTSSPADPTTTAPSVTVHRLPATGTTTDMVFAWAIALIVLGAAALFVVRRPL